MKMQIFGKDRKKRATLRSLERKLTDKLDNDQLTKEQSEAIESRLKTVTDVRDKKSQTAGIWVKVVGGLAITGFAAWAAWLADDNGIIAQFRNSQEAFRRSKY